MLVLLIAAAGVADVSPSGSGIVLLMMAVAVGMLHIFQPVEETALGDL